MAIQPIDLQTLYTQLDKIAKTVSHQQQGVTFANSIQQAEHAKREAEKKAAVQDIPTDGQSVGMVDERSERRKQNPQGQSKAHNDENDPADENGKAESPVITDPNLGKYVDVSG